MEKLFLGTLSQNIRKPNNLSLWEQVKQRA
jgi:hypothetical protein